MALMVMAAPRHSSTNGPILTMLSNKAKEAIKLGLAMTLAYFVGMRMGWMNPVWAAIAVAMISLPTAGQSLNKGLLRMGGTLLAWVIGMFYLGLFPQDRWLFLLSFSPMLFFLTYKMTGKDGQYFWFVAAFVSMMIMQQLPSGADNAFEFATFRALETLVGIVIWTLVSVFIWPQTNLDTLEDISIKLLATEQTRMTHCEALITGGGDDRQPIRAKEGSLVTALEQTLSAAASENYEVNEVRPCWQRFLKLSTVLMEIADRLEVSSPELACIELSKILPDLPAFFCEIDARLIEARNIIEGTPPTHPSTPVALPADEAVLATLDNFQRAAFAVARGELKQIDELTAAMVDSALGIKALGSPPAAAQEIPSPVSIVGPLGLPPLDRDRLMSSAMVVASMWVATLVYIYINPPGHSSWFQFVPNVVMIAAQNPQLRLAIFKPFAIAYPAVLLVYVFVMPQLSMFWQLGLVIFTLSFINRYFFTGLASIAIFLGMFSMLGIQNEQTYNFAAMANSYVFTMLGLGLVYLMTYCVRSPRPEKQFAIMLGRFFHSGEFLMSRLSTHVPGASLWVQVRIAYHRQEIRSLPAKLGAWGKQIDRHKFPANSQQDVTRLVASLQVMTYRVEDLIVAHSAVQPDQLTPLQGDIDDWRLAIEQGFKVAAEHSDIDAAKLREQVSARLRKLNARIETLLKEAVEVEADEADRRHFYQLLGAFRSVSQAAITYADQAGNIDWSQWQEERF
jgi:uncharacterized membrane protein YccC